jgi:hypothetical protein
MDPSGRKEMVSAAMGQLGLPAFSVGRGLDWDSLSPSAREGLNTLFLARLRLCVHYCIDRDAVHKKKTAFLTLSDKKNRASRGFLVGLSTKKLRMI